MDFPCEGSGDAEEAVGFEEACEVLCEFEGVLAVFEYGEAEDGFEALLVEFLLDEFEVVGEVEDEVDGFSGLHVCADVGLRGREEGFEVLC